MSFLSIVPRMGTFLNNNDSGIPLTVIRSNGVDTTPGFNMNVTKLNKGYKQFTQSSDAGDSFKVKVIFKKDDTSIININGKNLTKLEAMDYIIRNKVIVLVTTEALDVPPGDYLITSNPSRTQTYKDDTVWELEFHSYAPLNLVKYTNDNTAVLNAINKAKSKNKSKSTKSSSVKYQKLKDCGYKNLKYSAKKKVVACVKVLQEVLVKNKVLTKKQIDGWYGKTTLNAVKKYQQNYNKKYKVTNTAQSNSGGIFKVYEGTLISGKMNKTTVNKKTPKISKKLPVNGKVDKATWTALYKGE